MIKDIKEIRKIIEDGIAELKSLLKDVKEINPTSTSYQNEEVKIFDEKLKNIEKQIYGEFGFPVKNWYQYIFGFIFFFHIPSKIEPLIPKQYIHDSNELIQKQFIKNHKNTIKTLEYLISDLEKENYTLQTNPYHLQKIINNRNLSLHSPGWIIWATILGGPFATGLLLYRNSISIQNIRKGITIFSIFITYGLVLIFANLFAEITNSIPLSTFSSFISHPVTFWLTTIFIIEKYFGNEIRKYFRYGSEKKSGWKSTIIGISGFVVTFIIYIVATIAIGIENY